MSEPLEGAPDLQNVAAIVRRGLKLAPGAGVQISEVGELANINYVYRIETGGRSLYLKIVPERPKRFPVKLPRKRVFSEATALQLFHDLASGSVVVPNVLFLDQEQFAFAMTDVGAGRQVLFGILPDRLDLLTEQAENLGRALASVHGGTRHSGSLRPRQEEAMVCKVVFDGLLAPGALHAFPELWEDVRAEMQEFHECLIHADLWSKNLLVRAGDPVAIVDFEGVVYGDPAFDLGTLIAVALVPALERPKLLPQAIDFTFNLLRTWSDACGDGR